MDKIYTPNRNEQLIITADYAEQGMEGQQGISATLWAVDSKEERRVVARMSAELQPQQSNLSPCDGEATAVFVASKSPAFSTPIRASIKKTLALVDNKPVVEAANLLKSGKFSTSRMINNILTSITELNLDFHHVSGKMGRNCSDDFSSRCPIACDDPMKCKIHSFIRECASFNISTMSVVCLKVSEGAEAIVGNLNMDKESQTLKDILTGKARLPLDNKKALLYLQDRDSDITRVKELLRAGQTPNEKRDTAPVKIFFRSDTDTSIDRDGCLVVTKLAKRSLTKRTLVVVPEDMSLGLLYSLHVNLAHPTKDQLLQAVNTRFFMANTLNKCREVTESCTLCTATEPIPKELFEYKTNTVPDHPGTCWTVDILRESNKVVVVAVCNFSGYISTAFIPSEKEPDLADRIIITTTPFRPLSIAKIRVDRAPGFTRLSNMPEKLAGLGIELELGDTKNKNSLALVDEKMKELRAAMRKVSPSANVLNNAILSRATTVVNETIRHHRLSAKEILFSRSQVSSENLDIKDEDIAEAIENFRASKSAEKKSSTRKAAKIPDIAASNLVFIKDDNHKTRRRDMYMVLEVGMDNTAVVYKIRDAISNKNASMAPQDPRYRYRVKVEQLWLAPNQPTPSKQMPMPTAPIHMEKEMEEVKWQEPIRRHPQPHHTAKPETAAEDDDLDLIFFEPRQPQHHNPGGQIHDQVDVQEEDQPWDQVDAQVDQVDMPHVPDPQHDVEQAAAEVHQADDDPIDHGGPAHQQQQDDAQQQQQQDDAILVQDPADAGGVVRLDQHRRPARDDIMTYWDGEVWLKVRIIEKVAGYKHYYNVTHEDGRGDAGVTCKPPTAREVQYWSLLRQEDWEGQEEARGGGHKA